MALFGLFYSLSLFQLEDIRFEIRGAAADHVFVQGPLKR
jgi:hypothetical protein